MRRTRAAYHYAIRCIKKNEESIIRNRVAHAFLDNGGRNFWIEINKIWSKKAPNCKIVDDCASEASIAERFALRYEDLYSSVPYDHSVLHDIR